MSVVLLLALALWENFFSNGGYQSVQEYSCKHFPCDRKQSFPLKVVTVRFVQSNNDCITEVMW